MMARPIEMPFGDVKLGGRITVSTINGHGVAMEKITPMPASDVQGRNQYELAGAIKSPPSYNAKNAEGCGRNFSFLPNETLVLFHPDY